jgi:hypothetical protein
MIRDSDRHLSGFAKVRKPGLILGKLEMTKNYNRRLVVVELKQAVSSLIQGSNGALSTARRMIPRGRFSS